MLFSFFGLCKSALYRTPLFVSNAVAALLVTAIAAFVAYVFESFPIHGKHAVLINSGIAVAVWTGLFLIGRLQVVWGKPFSMFSDERRFILQENGGPVELITDRNEKTVFSLKDLKWFGPLLRFNFMQFSRERSYHFFEEAWLERIEMDSAQTDFGLPVEVEAGFEANDAEVGFFRYMNGHIMKGESHSILKAAAAKVLGVGIKKEDGVLKINEEQIRIQLKEEIERKILEGKHLFSLAGIQITIVLKISIPRGTRQGSTNK